jgi:hypothetical protein
VFEIRHDHLYYADFKEGTSGGEIVAIDLKSGRDLWRSRLDALGAIPHSMYSNRMNLLCTDTVVAVFGDEGGGRYLEFKDIDTGKTVGHRVYPKDTLPAATAPSATPAQ